MSYRINNYLKSWKENGKEIYIFFLFLRRDLWPPTNLLLSNNAICWLSGLILPSWSALCIFSRLHVPTSKSCRKTLVRIGGFSKFASVNCWHIKSVQKQKVLNWNLFGGIWWIKAIKLEAPILLFTSSNNDFHIFLFFSSSDWIL